MVAATFRNAIGTYVELVSDADTVMARRRSWFSGVQGGCSCWIFWKRKILSILSVKYGSKILVRRGRKSKCEL